MLSEPTETPSPPTLSSSSSFFMFGASVTKFVTGGRSNVARSKGSTEDCDMGGPSLSNNPSSTTPAALSLDAGNSDAPPSSMSGTPLRGCTAPDAASQLEPASLPSRGSQKNLEEMIGSSLAYAINSLDNLVLHPSRAMASLTGLGGGGGSNKDERKAVGASGGAGHGGSNTDSTTSSCSSAGNGVGVQFSTTGVAATPGASSPADSTSGATSGTSSPMDPTSNSPENNPHLYLNPHMQTHSRAEHAPHPVGPSQSSLEPSAYQLYQLQQQRLQQIQSLQRQQQESLTAGNQSSAAALLAASSQQMVIPGNMTALAPHFLQPQQHKHPMPNPHHARLPVPPPLPQQQQQAALRQQQQQLVSSKSGEGQVDSPVLSRDPSMQNTSGGHLHSISHNDSHQHQYQQQKPARSFHQSAGTPNPASNSQNTPPPYPYQHNQLQLNQQQQHLGVKKTQECASLEHSGAAGVGGGRNRASLFETLVGVELCHFLLETESRALILFNVEHVSAEHLTRVCERLGTLAYLRMDFRANRGVVFLAYHDLRASLRAFHILPRELGAMSQYDTALCPSGRPPSPLAPTPSVHYSIMLNAATTPRDGILLVRETSPSSIPSHSLPFTESDVQAVFSSYGQLKNVHRRILLSSSPSSSNTSSYHTVTPPSGSLPLPPGNGLAFLVEFYDVQDAKAAASELASTTPWGASVQVEEAERAAKERQLGQQLLLTLHRWREEGRAAQLSAALASPLSGTGGGQEGGLGGEERLETLLPSSASSIGTFYTGNASSHGHGSFYGGSPLGSGATTAGTTLSSSLSPSHLLYLQHSAAYPGHTPSPSSAGFLTHGGERGTIVGKNKGAQSSNGNNVDRNNASDGGNIGKSGCENHYNGYNNHPASANFAGTMHNNINKKNNNVNIHNINNNHNVTNTNVMSNSLHAVQNLASGAGGAGRSSVYGRSPSGTQSATPTSVGYGSSSPFGGMHSSASSSSTASALGVYLPGMQHHHQQLAMSQMQLEGVPSSSPLDPHGTSNGGMNGNDAATAAAAAAFKGLWVSPPHNMCSPPLMPGMGPSVYGKNRLSPNTGAQYSRIMTATASTGRYPPPFGGGTNGMMGGGSGGGDTEFHLDVERILMGMDRRTTIMVRNVPNKVICRSSLLSRSELSPKL